MEPTPAFHFSPLDPARRCQIVSIASQVFNRQRWMRINCLNCLFWVLFVRELDLLPLHSVEGYVVIAVYLFIYLYVYYSHYSKSMKPNRMKLGGMIGYYPGTI